jgi:hypothetical protein
MFIRTRILIFFSIPVPGSRGQKGTGSRILIRNTAMSVPFVVLGVLLSEHSHQHFVQNHHILPVYLLHVGFEKNVFFSPLPLHPKGSLP